VCGSGRGRSRGNLLLQLVDLRLEKRIGDQRDAKRRDRVAAADRQRLLNIAFQRIRHSRNDMRCFSHFQILCTL
jgi:hypothetical protein